MQHIKKSCAGRRVLRVVLAIACLALLTGCGRQAEDAGPPQEITVGAAANLTNVFEELARRFTAQTGIRVVLSFGATADLARQIENGAPFDVFAAADVAHVEQLERKNLLVEQSRALYARGRLVLWVPPGGRARIGSISDLTSADVEKIAIAKPELAPYGQAAVEALRALGLWTQIEPKVAYAQNVSQAKQFASTGNAEAAFIPKALVKAGEGDALEIGEHLHQPINQALGVIKSSTKQEAARRFVAFLLSEEGQTVFESYGYIRPSRQAEQSVKN